tara:strand:- start:663 stop:1097 length:435 start_codon:yes stop_codon:yes gene_type:complete
MAHFAELDSNNIVLRVVVVGNDIVANNGTLGDNDMHLDGESWCINFFKGGIWKQTSYNGNFRKQYCGIGYTYDSVKDKFISPQPYTSWGLDANDDWKAPVAYPNIDQSSYTIFWNEDNLRWLGNKISDNSNYKWDSSTLTWVSL